MTPDGFAERVWVAMQNQYRKTAIWVDRMPAWITVNRDDRIDLIRDGSLIQGFQYEPTTSEFTFRGIRILGSRDLEPNEIRFRLEYHA